MSKDKNEPRKRLERVDGSPAEPMTEAKREALVAEWANAPSRNPFYRGKTPAEVARLLFTPRN